MLERFKTMEELSDYIVDEPIPPAKIKQGQLVYFKFLDFFGVGEIVGPMHHDSPHAEIFSVRIIERFPNPEHETNWGHGDNSALHLEGENFWNVNKSLMRLVHGKPQLELF